MEKAVGRSGIKMTKLLACKEQFCPRPDEITQRKCIE
jgi:hypothetical protein